jgi:hypothetical protein
MNQGADPIVGRAEPLADLMRVVRASAGGRRSAILVGGVAGMGKTSLIRTALALAADEAPEGRLLVGWGTCWQGGGAPGFWPWMQALDELARAAGSEAAIAASGQDRDTLAALIRELGPAPARTDDPERRRFLLLDAAVRWLDRIAAQQPVILVLDDLQWADASTLDLLDHLISVPAQTRLLLVGAFRHDELSAETSARLASLGSRTHHLHLDGLAVEHVAELVATISGPERARELGDELHRRTGGHPLFVRELARLSSSESGAPLPGVVTGAVLRRVEHLPPATRHVLDAGSVLGNRLLLDVLAQVVDEPVSVVLAQLDGALEAGVIRAGDGGEVWFAHDLYRETLYGELGLAERARLHALVAEALELRHLRGAGVPPGDLARHFALAVTSTDPTKAISWARAAALDERGRSAFGESAAHLRRARSAVSDVGFALDPGELVEMLILEADAQARSGQPDAARALLAQAARSATSPLQETDVALAVQRLGAKFATPRREILAQLESARAAVTGHDPARQAQVTAALARELQHSVAEDRRRAGPLSEEALALAREAGDDETLVACLLARHDALWVPGTGELRSRLGREIATVAARLGDTDRRAEGLLLEANGLLEAGSPGFRAVLDQWFGLLETRNEPRDRYLVLTRRAALALVDGEAERAEALMYAAAELGEGIHEPDTGNVLMSQRVALARVHNDPDELVRLADDAISWWTGAPVLAHAVAAGALAAAGALEAAAREVALLSDAGLWRSEDSYLRSVLVAELARAVTALHDAELCALLLEQVLPLADSCGVNGALVAFAGPFAHTAGILAAELGELELADSLFARSIATSSGLGAMSWLHQSEAAQRTPRRLIASMSRAGGVWTVAFADEHGTLPHVKGLADLATLVARPRQEFSALHLFGGVPVPAAGREDVIDARALAAYRTRLDELEVEIELARSDADLARLDRLGEERELLFAEVRRSTGIGGRVRTVANDPAERARKAVSARIRDAIRRIDGVAPQLAAHLDRSIVTGLHCAYAPTGADAAVHWRA